MTRNEKKTKKDVGYTTLRVRESTKEKLVSLGKKNETFDEIISRLLEK